MKIKKMLPDNRKILKFTIIGSGILILLLLSVIGMTYATSAPKFCSTCHIMKPEHATWEASSHSQINCVTCHVDPGLTNALKHKVVAAKELYLYITKGYELPVQMTEKLPDSRCLQCHSVKRKVSPSYPGLYIPHELHYDKKVACVKCHQGVAHGKIASSGMTMGGNFNEWDKERGAGVMVPKNMVPGMDLCMDCHGRRGVTIACEACHSGSMKPDSHRDKTFKAQHGSLAKKDIKSCDVCHSFIKAPGVTAQNMPDEDPVTRYLNSISSGPGGDSGYAEYAQTNEYCVDCHQKRPITHDDNWPFNHGKEADKDNQRCLVCHAPRGDVKGTTKTGACASCHPSIHKYPWRKSHPITIPPKYARLEPRCFSCHVKDVCTSCHGTREKNLEPLPRAKVTIETEKPGSDTAVR
ncbi:MAG: hypothetical protein CVU89_07970 [Firmicutes bacterium HGW-Firmicutes-14]|nr:MAG: hypothetical protein CVU89_07970 [Firmicutes bacterium HGW-Firmicutes-14]